MKSKCLHCNKELGFFNSKKALLDGMICSNCYNDMIKYGMSDYIGKLKNCKYVTFEKEITKKIEMCNKFEIEDGLGEFLKIDYKNKLLVINDVIMEFENLKSVDVKFNYESIATTTSTTKTKRGGLGRALVGGMLFGGSGAIVGGLTGKSKSKTFSQDKSFVVCSSVKILLILKNYYNDSLLLNIDSDSKEIDDANCEDLEDFGQLLKIKFNKILKKRYL